MESCAVGCHTIGLVLLLRVFVVIQEGFESVGDGSNVVEGASEYAETVS